MLEVLKAFSSCAALIISVYAFGVIVLNNGKIKLGIKDIASILIVCILNTICFVYLDGTTKTIFTFIVYALLYVLVFNTQFLKSIFSGIIYMILLIIPDLILLGVITKVLNLSKDYCYGSIKSDVK